MKWIRSLYDWVLHWAKTPYGVPALFILAFAESSFFPIPPDILLIALALSVPTKSFRFALVCSVGSLLGGIVGYGIGWGLWGSFESIFIDYIPGFTQERFLYIQGLYKDYDFWIVFIAGFTPIPYKIFTILAGVMGINLPIFILASALSRSARFFLVAGLIYKFGPTISKFIDKYFNWLTLAFMVLLIGAFFILK
ncbi:MAG: cytochrome b561 [bacterium]|nr:MAG: cytochrome b561 [bacterium]